jgi:hypothetical protein
MKIEGNVAPVFKDKKTHKVEIVLLSVVTSLSHWVTGGQAGVEFAGFAGELQKFIAFPQAMKLENLDKMKTTLSSLNTVLGEDAHQHQREGHQRFDSSAS